MTVTAEQARLFINALDEPALIIRNGRTLAASNAAKALLGGGIEGSDVRIAIRHPEALSIILAGRHRQLELVGIGGAARPWQLSVKPFGNGLVLVRLSDRSAARAAERMRTDFVANASHELRTPLATIIGYAETLADEAPADDAMRRKFGATIETEARRMLRIVEDLMSLSRIEADRYRLPDERVHLGKIARIAADNAESLAERRGSRVEVEILDDIPEVSGDFSQLLQMVDNLIANALRYGCPKPGAPVTVRVGSTDGRIKLQVIDRGDGVDPRHLPRLTERFYRVDPARSRESGGTGLGLAIVKHIVERHRGSLDIISAPGKGTTVTVTLHVH
ncbi:ATP-binding protein [Sphingomonas xanthus]|uniref:histidine kinase n=1 Tax=Sphingomonas xanthus TaxID=2594473 RepID=A0A516IQM9_9SPHN|nr:ATP-binding protein [Sphingomonas xanthus]QDP19220.1 ATPase [Sphingomonas xanthus]